LCNGPERELGNKVHTDLIRDFEAYVKKSIFFGWRRVTSIITPMGNKMAVTHKGQLA